MTGDIGDVGAAAAVVPQEEIPVEFPSETSFYEDGELVCDSDSETEEENEWIDLSIGHHRNVHVVSDGSFVRISEKNESGIELFGRYLFLSARNWINFVAALEEIDRAVARVKRGEVVNFSCDLGGQLYARVKSGIHYVDIRRARLNAALLDYPGFALKFLEYTRLRKQVHKINLFFQLGAVPEATDTDAEGIHEKLQDLPNTASNPESTNVDENDGKMPA